MDLDVTAKVQIHVGGVYGDKSAAMARFAVAYAGLPDTVRRRLVIENDDRHYSLTDCLQVHERTGVPVLFDFFHHALNNRDESVAAAVRAAAGTWVAADGCLMTDYSSQEPGQRRGTHAQTLDTADFRRTLRSSQPCNFDIMLEIKDKERSAATAQAVAGDDPRLAGVTQRSHK
jgi:UV DNA damage endonuclease